MLHKIVQISRYGLHTQSKCQGSAKRLSKSMDKWLKSLKHTHTKCVYSIYDVIAYHMIMLIAISFIIWFPV